MAMRLQIMMDPDIKRRARAKAAALGISLAEYVRRLVAGDLEKQKAKREIGEGKADISIVFDLVGDRRATSVAREKDSMIGHAVWQNHLRKTRRKRSARFAKNSG